MALTSGWSKVVLRVDLRQFLFVPVFVGLTACGQPTVALEQSVPSPDRTLIADWYVLAAGGGAGSTVDVVRLRPATEPFRADSGYSFSAISADPVIVRWISNTELEVSYDERGHVRTSDHKWKNVTIRYQPRRARKTQ
jgi:hypothetical protein